MSEINFLKRTFVQNEDGIFTGPLDIEVVRDMTNWVRGNTPKQSLMENADSAIREFGLHGRKTFEEEAELLRKACANVNVKLRIPTYGEMESIYAVHRAQ